MARMTPKEKIEWARQQLLWDHPFFLIISFQLEWIETTDPNIATMETNGIKLYWNPDFVDELTAKQVLFVVIHELYHVILRHHIRGVGKIHEKFNVAADHAVNLDLIDLKIGEMPTGKWRGHADPQYKGLTAEEIYQRLPDPPGGWGGMGGGMGAVIMVADANDMEHLDKIAEAEARIDIMIQQAADAARRQPGKVPAGIMRLIEELLEPKVNWREILWRFLSAGQREDSTWLKPNKRYMHAGIYLPGIVKEGVNHIVFIIDTSGSVDGPALLRVVSEIAGAFCAGIIQRITVISCDAAVHKVQEFNEGDELKVEAEGGGGTSFAPAMAYVNKNIDDAAAVIYFTDMYCNSFGEKPDCPVLWGIFGNKKQFAELSKVPPYGESIYIDE